MKRLLSGSILAAVLLLLAAVIQARSLPGTVHDSGVQPSTATGPCATLSLKDLRGTYAFTANAWQDLSEINPALPRGYAPVTIIGAFAVNFSGALTGWALVNAGGLQMSAQFVNSSFGEPRTDCSFPVTLSMKINEFGDVVTGPYAYVGVVTSK